MNHLLDQEETTTLYWYDEPGGAQLTFSRFKDRHHMLQVTIDDFSESYGSAIQSYEKVCAFEVKQKHLITLFYYQLKKIETLLQEKSFASIRGSHFPFQDFRKLEKKVLGYLGLQETT